MNESFFLDTNIFVYSFDRRDTAKQDKARLLIRTALENSGSISWQVIQEFSNVALKGFVAPFDHATLREYLDTVLLPLCTLFPNREIYQEALGVQKETGFSWYESLIVTAAIKVGCKTLYTEDLQHGQIIRGVSVINPFR